MMDTQRIDIITIFPEYFTGPLNESMMRLASDKGTVDFKVVNLRNFAEGKHRVTDDYPFGGDAGMVMKPEPIVRAVESLRDKSPGEEVILLTPAGRRFDQQLARELSKKRHLIFICGHYRGIDERVRTLLKPLEISIGDYVLTGGEPAALVICDAVVRLLPGVLGNPDSPENDSFSMGILDYPHYTRPREYQELAVPSVLLSGNHEDIRRFRRKEALRKTRQLRPDLLERKLLSEEDYKFLRKIEREEEN